MPRRSVESSFAAAKAEARRALKNQRLGLAALSASELQSGRPVAAVHLALAAWPRRPDPADNLSDYSVALTALSEAGLAQRETARLFGHEREVNGVAFSPDGTRIATSSDDGTARIWDPSTGREMARFDKHEDSVWSVAFSPDGTRLASVSDNSLVLLWDAATGRETARLKGHEGLVTSAAFSPDGTRIATSSDDGTARIWDLSTGRETARLEGHEVDQYGQFSVTSVAFSPDGTRLATGGRDRMARIWNVDYGLGNIFEVHCRRLPTKKPPAIVETYGIDLGEPICSGEEPLPPLLPREADQ